MVVFSPTSGGANETMLGWLQACTDDVGKNSQAMATRASPIVRLLSTIRCVSAMVQKPAHDVRTCLRQRLGCGSWQKCRSCCEIGTSRPAEKKNLHLCRVDAFENPHSRGVPQVRILDPTAGWACKHRTNQSLAPSGYFIGSSKGWSNHEHRRGHFQVYPTKGQEASG